MPSEGHGGPRWRAFSPPAFTGRTRAPQNRPRPDSVVGKRDDDARAPNGLSNSTLLQAPAPVFQTSTVPTGWPGDMIGAALVGAVSALIAARAAREAAR